jgi:MFS family permease
MSDDLSPRPEPAASWRWLVLLALSAALATNYYLFDALNPVGPLLEKQLGVSQEGIGLLDTAYNAAALLVLLAGGVLVDRLGTGRAVVLFAAVAAGAGFVLTLAPPFSFLLAGRCVLGLGSEPLIVAATTALGRWFRGKELAFAMGLNLTFSRLGSVAADNSAGWAAPLFASWRGPLVLAAAVGAFTLVFGAAYALLERAAERRFALGRAGATDKLVLSGLLRFERGYWYVVGLCVAFYAAVFPFRRFANVLFADVHGVSAERAGAMNGLLPLAAMVATPLFGLLADRYGKRALLLVLGTSLLLPVYLVMGYTRVPLVVPVVAMGIAFSLVPALLWPAVTYLVPEGRLGTAYALMTFCQQLAWAATSWGVGAANDWFGASAAHPGGYRPGLWIFTALAAAGFAFAALLWRAERSGRGHGLELPRPR